MKLVAMGFGVFASPVNAAGALGGATRDRHVLAGASTPAYFTV